MIQNDEISFGFLRLLKSIYGESLIFLAFATILLFEIIIP